MRLSESPMPNILFFLSAILIEVLAWSGLHLLNEHADSALMTYFIVHAVASILFAFSLRPLILASHQLREHRLALLGLVALVSFTIPIAGAAGCLRIAADRSNRCGCGRRVWLGKACDRPGQ